jgi:hypothetical protein
MDDLSDTKIRNATPADKEYAMADGQGLSVVVRPNGTKLWLYRYRFGSKRKNMRLASFPASDSRLRAKSATAPKSCSIRVEIRSQCVRLGHVVERAHMREQCVILKHDAEFACPWRPFRHVVAPERNPASMRPEETGNQFQQRRLTAAGRADHRAEFAWCDTQRDIVDAAGAGTVAKR